ncbi:A/G-specific adenine glycosylase [Noviherbaspirillum galbum]|uniref:Adenine DNA glycosylase n=1 Tax=Noviherbaspirillum galbum TaxID=2709383 RepID=A0A6B3SUZ2_9BURK|nr:A/G-specific adenine glycosylase [Noviherbaspirillum galbum]NEX64341.1 A/G-specific adenine glycosylase [Noviherbaspirillum galbum]
MKRVAGKPAVSAGAEADFRDPTFSEDVIHWQKRHGRHALPWQNTDDAYRIWLSEIMLQQTQVAAVIPYYERFLERFPDVRALAQASQDEVMAYWSGLGYYSRARNLHRCAQRVVQEYGGVFPAEPALLADLPGIGRSTAAAITAFANGTRAAILDGNVKRVFCRVFGVEGDPGTKPVEDMLWKRAEALLPQSGMQAYTQGLMDLGATVCVRGNPLCSACPLAARCVALATGRTRELPHRKPKKAVPEKHASMLVIVSGGDILLEQRPDSGIWGGLLSLPEMPSLHQVESRAEFEALAAEAATAYGRVSRVQALPAFTHVFTHFKLHVMPVRVDVSRPSTDAALPPGAAWHPVTSLANAALPAPVKKLLLALFGAPDLLSGL